MLIILNFAFANYALHQEYTQARTSACFAEIHVEAFNHRHGTGASQDRSLKEKRKESVDC